MPVIMQQLLGYCFSGSLIGIPIVAVLWIVGKGRLASIATFACMIMAGALVFGLIVGLPELFGWIPHGTILFPKGYPLHLYRNINAYYFSNLLWATILMLSMGGLWVLRKS